MADEEHNDPTDQQEKELPWYVMWHLNPTVIETMLLKDSRGAFNQEGVQPLAPYRYYIPYKDMPLIVKDEKKKDEDDEYSDKHYDAVADQNALRSDLHNFVFIQATYERARAIVLSEWNAKARLHMYWYRDTTGKEVTLKDSEVHALIKTIEDRHLKFYFDQPLDEFALGDKVILQMEPWTGKIAEVRKVTVKKDRIRITVSLNILGRTKSINFPDVKVGDVRFVDPQKGQLLSGNPIDNYEYELLDILHNRFVKTPDAPRSLVDEQRLKRLSTYGNIYVEDPQDAARFLSLKLICAYLRNDKKRVARYTAEVQALLDGSTVPTTDAEAQLLLALFLVTRDVTLRTAVKTYRNDHPESSDTLRRYLSVLKNVKAKPL